MYTLYWCGSDMYLTQPTLDWDMKLTATVKLQQCFTAH
jgi:hypothetical protein